MDSAKSNAPRKRIALVAWFLKPSRLWLGEHLDPAKFECDYTGSATKVDLSSKRTPLRVWLGFFLLAGKSRWKRLWKRQDLVVSAFPPLGMMVELVKLLTFDQTPHLVWYFNCGHQYKGVRLWISKLVFRRVKGFIVFSRAERRNYARWFDLPEDRFHFTYLTGPALERKESSGVRKKYNLPERYLASLGSSGRDYKTLFAACAALDFPAVVVTQPYALKGLTPPPSVRVIESVPQEDFLDIVAEAELIVVTLNNAETASGQLTVMQAMTLGVPVIATNSIGTEDYIRHGENGYLIPMGDAEKLRAAIQELLGNPALRERVAGKALAFAKENFSEAASARLLEKIGETV